MRPGAGRRIAIGALAAVAVVVGVWRLLPGSKTATPVAAEVAPAERFVASWSVSLANAKRMTREVHTSAIAALPPARKASEVEVCGVGVVDLASPEGAAQIKRASDDAEVVVGRLIQAMQTSADIGMRAIGLYLGSVRAGMEAARDNTAQEGDCGASQACGQQLESSMRDYRNGAQPLIDTLARVASTTLDPMAYGIAVQACRSREPGQRRAGACQLVSAEQWARLDPDNAVAWLHVAASAHSRDDGAVEVDALQRVASARGSRLYGDRAPDVALSLLPVGIAPLERADVEFSLLVASVGWALPEYQSVSRYCSVEAVRDANRRQSCDAIASSLVAHGSTLIDLAIGKVVGTRAGWPDERIDAVKAEFDAARAIQARIFPTGDEMLACDSIAKVRTYLGRVAQGGELGAVRLAIQESGETIADLAREYRVAAERSMREAQLRNAAEQAASASASAASSGS